MTTAPPTIDVGSTAVEIHARAVEFARCATWTDVVTFPPVVVSLWSVAPNVVPPPVVASVETIAALIEAAREFLEANHA